MKNSLAIVAPALIATALYLYPPPAAATAEVCQEARSEAKDLAEKIREALESERAKDKLPLIAYSVFNRDCLLTSGMLSEQQSALTQSSPPLLRLASTSKVFTTLAAAQLIEAGILHPDMKIMDLTRAEFVRFLRANEPKERLDRWSKITIRHLMTHQSGTSKDIPGALVFFNSESLTQNTYPTFEDLYRGLTQVEFLFEPNAIETGVKYSNLGMNLLARIVEAYNPEEVSFPAYVKRRILEPLGMNDTHYDLPAARATQLIPGFGALLPDGTRTSVQPAYFVGSYDGSIGLASTPEDLSKFGRELLRLTNGPAVLLKNPELISEFLTTKSIGSATFAWASGAIWQALPGESADDALWLGGSGTGASERNTLLVSAEKNFGLALLFNVIDANRDKYAKIISDVMNQPKTALTPFAEKILRDNRKFLKADFGFKPAPHTPYPNPERLEKFVGTYFADIVGFQAVSLSAEGDLVFMGQKLIVEDLQSGKFRFPLINGVAGAIFNYEPIVFSFDASGVPTSMRVANVKIFRRTSN